MGLKSLRPERLFRSYKDFLNLRVYGRRTLISEFSQFIHRSKKGKHAIQSIDSTTRVQIISESINSNFTIYEVRFFLCVRVLHEDKLTQADWVCFVLNFVHKINQHLMNPKFL